VFSKWYCGIRCFWVYTTQNCKKKEYQQEWHLLHILGSPDKFSFQTYRSDYILRVCAHSALRVRQSTLGNKFCLFGSFAVYAANLLQVWTGLNRYLFPEQVTYYTISTHFWVILTGYIYQTYILGGTWYFIHIWWRCLLAENYKILADEARLLGAVCDDHR